MTVNEIYFGHDGELISRVVYDAMNLTGNRIALTEITPSVQVSTAWLGTNWRTGGSSGPPLIFETLTYGGDFDEYCNRYATKAEALAGHEAIVGQVRAEIAEQAAYEWHS